MIWNDDVRGGEKIRHKKLTLLNSESPKYPPKAIAWSMTDPPVASVSQGKRSGSAGIATS